MAGARVPSVERRKRPDRVPPNLTGEMQMLRAAHQPRDFDVLAPNDLEAFWMPFTANRAFKKRPRLVVRAKDMHYYKPDGKAVLDGVAGMWCCNVGHNRDPIVAAV